MKQVSKEQFFKVIGPMNVHPCLDDPNQTSWEIPSRKVIGKTIPGWRNGYVNGVQTPKQYFLNVANHEKA